MVYFLGFLTLIMVWATWRLEVRGSALTLIGMHVVFALMTLGLATLTFATYLADRHQL